MSTYNGWTNHATWLVNLWIDNDESALYAVQDYCAEVGRFNSADFREFIMELFDLPCEGLAGDLCLTTLSDVDWVEIYEHHKPQDDEDEDFYTEGK